jgi:hypothetical protein
VSLFTKHSSTGFYAQQKEMQKRNREYYSNAVDVLEMLSDGFDGSCSKNN